MNSSTLLPTTFALNGNAAIDNILADIPLFCEGIMGIGVFTFLFVVKQVKWPLAFLYGSSFMAFAAATLDLTQILTRSADNAKDGNVNALIGFLFAREIFLSLSLLAVNLYYWKLVAMCPRSECINGSSRLTFLSSSGLRSHSASWERWGVLGMILKWGSLAALLAVPLLQLLWRLLADQHRFSPTYVADSIVQTTIMIILILKCGLNIFLSPLGSWWESSRTYIAPVLAMVLGAVLAVGNLLGFAFTETTLGRFLRAVEVYILFLHSLQTMFDRAIDAAKSTHTPEATIQRRSPWDPEKSDFRPIVSPDQNRRDTSSVLEIGPRLGYQVKEVSLRSKSPTPSWMSDSSERSVTRRRFEEEVLSSSSEVIRGTPQLVEQNVPPQSASPIIVTNPIGIFGSPPQSLAEPRDRRMTVTTVASYYSVNPPSLKPRASSPPPPSAGPFDIIQAYATSPPKIPLRTLEIDQPPKIRSPFDSQPGSQQASITSFDELLRQQTELDKSIAALKLLSTSDITPPSDVRTPDETSGESTSYPSQSILSKGEGSPSRSDFSLSVFPEPPSAMVEEEEGVGRDIRGSPTTIRRKMFNDGKPPALNLDSEPMPSVSPSQQAGLDQSARTQYDVTSFVGGMTSGGPSSGATLMRRTSTGELVPYSAEPPGTAGSTSTLRPMILATTVLSAAAEPSAVPSSLIVQGSPTVSSPSTNSPDSAVPLRPLLLGRPTPAAPLAPPGKIPLAQRRGLGGGERAVITIATRRPVIGAPRMNEDTEAPPDAFERPRPPPLIIK